VNVAASKLAGAEHAKFTQVTPLQQSASTLQLSPLLLQVPLNSSHVLTGGPEAGVQLVGARHAAVAGD
jgi:hypothetical protein